MVRRQKEHGSTTRRQKERGLPTHRDDVARGDVTQFNLRIKTEEYRRLVVEAEKNRVSLNGEMAHRLAQSLEQQTWLSLRQMHDDLEAWLLPAQRARHEKPHLDVLEQAVRDLLDCGSLPDSAKAKQAISEIRQALRMLELMRRQPKPPAYPGSD
jgi:hypothetical protein